VPIWPDLDASLDYDAGWRQRFFEADRMGGCRPVARPVFHRVAEAVFGPEGALARRTSGAAVAVYLQADGTGLILARADQLAQHMVDEGEPDGEPAGGGGDEGGRVVATVLPPGSRRPMTAGDLWAALAANPRRVLDPDPRAWPATTTCC
jgi:hypothetical protein